MPKRKELEVVGGKAQNRTIAEDLGKQVTRTTDEQKKLANGVFQCRQRYSIHGWELEDCEVGDRTGG